MKMLITFEPHAIFYLIIFCILIHFNIIETHVHVCKTVTRLHQVKCRSEQTVACKMSTLRLCCSQAIKLDFRDPFHCQALYHTYQLSNEISRHVQSLN